MAPSFKTTAAVLGLAAVASAAFNKDSRTNVAVYWGQGDGQLNLVETCKNADVDIVNIAFINAFPDNSPANYPGSNFGNQCWADTYTVNGVATKLYSHCNAIGPDIQTCQQQYGKTVMLSLGGAIPGQYYLAGDDSASYFAHFLWSAFGPVQPGYTGPRPFGDAVVDGFDFDIESYFATPPNDSEGNAITDYKSRGYASMVGYLREHYTEDPSKQYYVSGAPQCYLPEAWLGDAITSADFDWLFIQFYNTASCSARAAVNYSQTHSGDNINFNDWNTLTSGNSNVKLLLGLPAAPAAANPGYYLTQEEAYSVIKTVSDYSRFGGVGLWESTYSQKNLLCGKEYASWMKTFVNAAVSHTTIPANFASCPVVSSSSAIVSSSAVVSSSAAQVSSSAAVTSSAAQVSSSAVVSSSAAQVSSSAAQVSSSVAQVSSSAIVSSSAAQVSSSAIVSTSSAHITSAASASASAECMSKPSNLHTKSRTRAHHSIRHCTGNASQSCIHAPSGAHSKSRTRAAHSIGHCTGDCSTGTAATPSKTRSLTASASVSVSASAHASSSRAAVQSSSAKDYTVTDITSVYTTYCPGTTVFTTDGHTITAQYDSTTVVTTTIRTTVPCSTASSSAAAVSSKASATSKAGVTSSIPASSNAAVQSSSAKDYTVTEIVSVYTTYCPGTATITTGGSTLTSTYDSTTVVTTTVRSTLPVTSSAAAQTSSAAVASSSAPASNYVVTDITTIYTTYCPGTSTIVTGGSTITSTYDSSTVVTSTIQSTVSAQTSTVVVVVTSSAPHGHSHYHSSSTSQAVDVSSVPVYGGSSSPAAGPSSAPVYGGASSSVVVVVSTVPAAGPSSAPVYGGSSSPVAVPSSANQLSQSAPGGYQTPASSVAAVTSSSPGVPGTSGVVASTGKALPSASIGTVYVVPVGPSSIVAKYTGSPSTTGKPATYTGAAIKPVVGMGMLPVVFGAAALLF